MKLLPFFFIKSNKQHRRNGGGFKQPRTKQIKWAGSKSHYILNSQFLSTIFFPGRTVFLEILSFSLIFPTHIQFCVQIVVLF